MRFMRDDEAVKTMSLFEGAQEIKRVTKRSLKNWVVRWSLLFCQFSTPFERISYMQFSDVCLQAIESIMHGYCRLMHSENAEPFP